MVTAHSWSYVVWMLIYLLSLPVWNFVLPTYAFWKFDDFSWGETRQTAGEKTKKAGIEYEGEFDSSKITMKRWAEFERDRRARNQNYWGSSRDGGGGGPGGASQSSSAQGWSQPQGHGPYDDYYSDV